jgi:hypothetical protein
MHVLAFFDALPCSGLILGRQMIVDLLRLNSFSLVLLLMMAYPHTWLLVIGWWLDFDEQGVVTFFWTSIVAFSLLWGVLASRRFGWDLLVLVNGHQNPIPKSVMDFSSSVVWNYQPVGFFVPQLVASLVTLLMTLLMISLENSMVTLLVTSLENSMVTLLVTSLVTTLVTSLVTLLVTSLVTLLVTLESTWYSSKEWLLLSHWLPVENDDLSNLWMVFDGS